MTSSTPIAKTQLGTAPYLPLSVAKKVSDIAMEEGLKEGYPVSVTVVDRDGVVINQQRDDTATGATVQVSFEKAYAAAGFQVPTADLQDAAAGAPPALPLPPQAPLASIRPMSFRHGTDRY